MKSQRKVALVTGSATGVGAATCVKLAMRGWNVVINYTKSQQEAEATAKKCSHLGSEVLICQADVSNNEACQSMVEKTIEKWGRIDALVNNAARTKFCSYSNLNGLSEADFLNLYEVNVVSAYQMTRATTSYLQDAEHPAVVNTSSISAISGVGSSMAYAASKGALSTLTLSLAHALAPTIRVNAVCPGFIEGRWTKNFLKERYEAIKNGIIKTSLLDRVCLPEDVADCIVFLIEDAKMMTGQILTVDGGKLVNQAVLG